MPAINLKVSRPEEVPGLRSPKVAREAVKEGEAILVTFEDAYIGDNHEPLFKGKAEIVANFAVSSHQALNAPLLLTATTGTLKNVDDHHYLDIARHTVIAGPFVPVGFVALGIAMSEVDSGGFKDKFGSIQDLLKHVPAVGAFQVGTFVGQLVSFLGSLDEDDVIIHTTTTYFTQENAVEGRAPLETGLYTFHSGEDPSDPRESRITLAVSRYAGPESR